MEMEKEAMETEAPMAILMEIQVLALEVTLVITQLTVTILDNAKLFLLPMFRLIAVSLKPCLLELQLVFSRTSLLPDLAFMPQ